ncbi:MAG: hypothetical protein OXU51_05420 [Candidatus Poribacteria bacterium]|nr:hypothetical protein [Candidatus Poribacteria bacterium]
MNDHIVCRVQPSTNLLQLAAIVILICGMSIVSFSTAFADAHEAEEAMEEQPMEEKPKITGWFQIDVDSLGTYFLVGASHPLSGGISFDSNIYVNDHLGEFDMGISFPVIANDSMALLLTPMLGVGFNYTSPDGPYALYPQIFAILPAGKIFGFHWTISTISSIFDDQSINELYNRTYITYALNDTVAIGPQFESVLGLGEKGALWALNLGGRVNIGYGENNTLGLYVGYETKKGEDETGLTGRMNFTRRW